MSGPQVHVRKPCRGPVAAVNERYTAELVNAIAAAVLGSQAMMPLQDFLQEEENRMDGVQPPEVVLRRWRRRRLSTS
jgi:hypothetical protein